MTAPQIAALLHESHRDFCKYISSLHEQQFLSHKEGKWSAGMQLEHIFRSVQPVRLAFELPKFMLRFIWGKSNREGRSYEALVAKYLQKLEQGGAASGRFIPKDVAYQNSVKLQKMVLNEIERLQKLITKFSESDLDTLVLPHPLLGKLTLREMLYFTNYHVKHHRNIIENALK